MQWGSGSETSKAQGCQAGEWKDGKAMKNLPLE
jgi:hypothetical protein